MPRKTEPLPKLLPLKRVLAALGGISEDTYRRRWQLVFTPRRSDGETHGRGSRRFVLSDELAAAVEHGPAGVLTLRKTKGRLEPLTRDGEEESQEVTPQRTRPRTHR